MRINEAFKGICEAPVSADERVAIQDAIRLIVQNRKALGIENDICALFDFKEHIAEDLGIDPRLLKKIFTLPSVSKVLQGHGYDVYGMKTSHPPTYPPASVDVAAIRELMDAIAHQTNMTNMTANAIFYAVVAMMGLNAIWHYDIDLTQHVIFICESSRMYIPFLKDVVSRALSFLTGRD